MKKTIYFLFLMFSMLIVSSCSKDIDLSTQKSDIRYKKAFENLIDGAVNSSVNWGFDDKAPYVVGDDGTATTRGVNANGNEWGLYVNVPQPLTDTQKTVVENWFKTHGNPTGIALNWSDFFVQQVYKGEWGSNMNYLYCGSSTDHTNNFNAGDAGTYGNVCYGLQEGATDNNQRVYGSDKIEFMVNSSTEYFGFHNSFDSNFYTDNYVIIPGDMIDESVSGMYFVGFDFEAHGEDQNTQQVERDYFFDNWIVKITPGLYKNGQRIMVEDLIANDLTMIDMSDWDFNDAVFDVAYLREYNNSTYQHEDYAVVTLWAAGGTKELTIAGNEVHGLFGKPVTTMINTGRGEDGLAPVIFRINLGIVTDWNKVYNASDIVVMAEETELKAETGKAPQKVSTATNTKWMKERKIITLAYPEFATYATTNAPVQWYNTVADELARY